MKTMRQLLILSKQINWQNVWKIITVALAASLIAAVCISGANSSDMQKKYTGARQAVGDALYGCSAMMLMEYDGADLVGADVEGSILPSMKMYYGQAQALNTAMTEAYGAKYAVFSGELIQEIDEAFSQYDGALRAGRSTADAAALMTEALEKLRTSLNNHYDAQGRLK